MWCLSVRKTEQLRLTWKKKKKKKKKKKNRINAIQGTLHCKILLRFYKSSSCWNITKTRLFKYMYIENFTSKNWKFSDINEYPQSMFLSGNKKNDVYPCKPQFYCIKVGFKGGGGVQNYIGMFSWWKTLLAAWVWYILLDFSKAFDNVNPSNFPHFFCRVDISPLTLRVLNF